VRGRVHEAWPHSPGSCKLHVAPFGVALLSKSAQGQRLARRPAPTVGELDTSLIRTGHVGCMWWHRCSTACVIGSIQVPSCQAFPVSVQC
jgi:hypothetical protein